MPPPPPPPPPSSSSSAELEFRSEEDDAWYSVRTVLDGNTLTIKYTNFTDEEDTVFEPNRFTSLDELTEFLGRFRPLSAQLQDGECHRVTKGTLVCASHTFTEDDIRFHDAIIEDVVHKEHSFTNGEEECLCAFVVLWQHGPLEGCLENRRIEHICLVKTNFQLDTNVAHFIETVRKKLGSGNQDIVPADSGGKGTKETKSPYLPRFAKGRKVARRSSSGFWLYEDINRAQNEVIEEDPDLGGNKYHHTLLIDFLDQDLLPSSIVSFIQHHASISVKACIFPSWPSDAYAKGAILLDNKKNLEKLCEFFDSPDHIVVSKRGRPFVVAGKLSGQDSFLSTIDSPMLKLQSQQGGQARSELKLIIAGSAEYVDAKKLKDLFKEFVEHQKRLHDRLAKEEANISENV